MLKPRCILCRKPVPDNHTRCVKHWLNNQNQWMEDDQPVHQHCTPRRRHTARIFTQEQLTDALASACVLEGVSILHRFQQADKDRRNLKAVARTMYETSGMPTIVEDDDE